MKFRIKYKTVFHSCVSQFDETVSEMLNNGWQLAGNAYCNSQYMFQPMLKQENEK